MLARAVRQAAALRATPPPALALGGSSLLLLRCLGTGEGGRGPKGERQAVVLREEDLDESFVKGSGKGGQKINKVRNCVLLKHVPSGLLVRCQKTRSLDDNRRVARKLLLQKLDDHVNGSLSARSAKIDKLRKKKRNRRARAKDKYGAASSSAEDDDQDSDVVDDSDVNDEEDDDEDDEDEGLGDEDEEDEAERRR